MVKVMIEKEVQLLFDSGELKKVSIVPALMSKGWYLQFDRKHGDAFALNAQRVSPRTFKTLDSAVEVARKIGFREARIAL
jgi:hypothetical protein